MAHTWPHKWLEKLGRLVTRQMRINYHARYNWLKLEAFFPPKEDFYGRQNVLEAAAIQSQIEHKNNKNKNLKQKLLFPSINFYRFEQPKSQAMEKVNNTIGRFHYFATWLCFTL